MISIHDSKIQDLLGRLHAAADAGDPAILDAARHEAAARGENRPSAREAADRLGEAYMPVSPEVGRLLYALARRAGDGNVVEFGTSFGISTIYLAAAVRDAGRGGRVITTELHPGKVARARANLAEAGLDAFVEFRAGDARETLRGLEGPVGFLLLDGWKDLYLPVLRLVEPALEPAALVIADDLDIQPEAHKPYLGYVRDPRNGYVSVELPVGDRMELSVRS